jgi:hypothetical protein
MRRGILLSGVPFLVALTCLAGCGGSGGKGCGGLIGDEHDACVTELRREQGKPPLSEVVSSETPVSRPPMPMVAKLYLASEEGYKAKVELRRGRLTHAEADAENGALYLGSACAVDYERDAAMPFELTITNTTYGYSAQPTIHVFARTPHGELPGVSAEIGYSSGPECFGLEPDASPAYEEDYGGYLHGGPSTPLEPGESTSAPGYFIVSNYYSPAAPSGNPDRIREALLEIAPAITDEHFQVSSASGVLNSQFVSNAIPVLPGGDGGCLIDPPCPALFKTE